MEKTVRCPGIMKDLPLSEITLRKYEKPASLERRELFRKICLSLGLLQLGDSRDIIVDILMILVEANKNKDRLTSEEINNNVGELRKKYSLPDKGMAESNIRRQLKRLRDYMLVDKQENKYFLIEHSSLKDIFEKNIEKFVIPPIIERIKEYLGEIEKSG